VDTAAADAEDAHAGNVVERVLRRVDGWQQGSRVVGPVFGVVRKFGDDRGPSLAALLAYYGLMSLFPLLLVLTTILGFVGNARLEESLIGTTLAQFPVVGDQIGRGAAHPLEGSGFALVIGLLGLLYGSLGVTQVAQRAMADVWNVPNVVRPGFLPRLARSVLFLLVLVVGLGATAVASAVTTASGHSTALRIATAAIGAVVNVVICGTVFRVLTPHQVPWRQLWPGAVAGGLGYSALLLVGTALVQHQLRHTEALYGQFGFVLGLIGWLYLVAQITLYASEINVVLARRLWPRSILQPPLTGADERVLSAIALQEERRPEQNVDVAFEHEEAR
jgi:YihY family inner membrane protein